MLKRILVPLDGSRLAERALPIALRLARATQGTIVLFRAVTTDSSQNVIAYELPAAAKFKAERYLVDLKKRPAFTGLSVETAVSFGTASTTILRAIDEQQIDLVVMCSRGYTGITRWLLGSVADKVTTLSPVPVLLIHDRDPLPAEPVLAHTWRALVPLDGSELAYAALEPAIQLIAALAAPERGALHLVQVVAKGDEQSHDPGVIEQKEKVLTKARTYLQQLASDIEEGKVAAITTSYPLTVTWSIAVSNDVADAIIDVAENGKDLEHSASIENCDFIAMSTHGRAGMSRWALGSVTDHVRAGAQLPLLIVRPVSQHQQFGIAPE